MIREILHFHLFCGLGGGAKGFNDGEARVDSLQARFRCLGGIDVDPAIVRDFERLSGVRGTALDLFDRQQYLDWHGREPPAVWREATPDDIRRAAGNERPHIVFTSPPCKGFSGLLNETRSRTAKYQALNRLTLRGLWLMLEAWADDPPEFVILENVPRIASRGRALLDQIESLLSRYGYAVRETTHDCGELGGLAQSRKRFLLVARHAEKVPPFLYEPARRPLQAVSTVLGRMPLPGAAAGGAMHRIPNLQWKTWVRLAFVESGSDWRSLNRLEVENGFLRDFAIAPDANYHAGVLGVRDWNETAGTVTGRSSPTTGAHAVADPRIDAHPRAVHHGVRAWHEPAPVVTGKMFVGGGSHAVSDPRVPHSEFKGYRVIPWDSRSGAITGSRSPGGSALSIADPRVAYSPNSHRNKFKVIDYGSPAGTVTGGTQVQGGALGVADPRCAGGFGGKGKYRVTGYEDPSGTIIGGSTTGQGAFAVADPRPGMARAPGDHYLTGGHYGVVDFNAPAYAVTGSACHDNGWNSVADPRLPEPAQNVVAIIRALDGTWHRPFTTLELAALQSLVDPEAQLELDGLSDSAWRERIGNAVPASAAQAIASVMGRTLLLAWSGTTFILSAEPIWVRPIAVALTLPGAPA